jgi:hypothetical protein
MWCFDAIRKYFYADYLNWKEDERSELIEGITSLYMKRLGSKNIGL